MSTYWICAFMFATFSTLHCINGYCQKGKTAELEPIGIIFGFILCFVFMPIVLIFFIIDEVIGLVNNLN